MTKDEFMKAVRPKIGLGAFFDQAFLSRVDIELIEVRDYISSFANFYCPWAHCGSELIEFDPALKNIEARAIKVSDHELIDLKPERKEKIEECQKKTISLEIIPLGLDTASGKHLLLDSNHTSIALYRNYLSSKEDKEVQMILIKGPNLETVIGDFIIVNR